MVVDNKTDELRRVNCGGVNRCPWKLIACLASYVQGGARPLDATVAFTISSANLLADPVAVDFDMKEIGICGIGISGLD